MVKINFPNEHRMESAWIFEQVPSMQSLTASRLRTGTATVLSSLVANLTSEDFENVGLSSGIPEVYGDPDRTLERVKLLDASAASRRPAAFYLLNQANAVTEHTVGLASFLRVSEEPLLRESYERMFTGWFNPFHLTGKESTESFATRSLSLAITVAGRSGLKNLQILQIAEPKHVDLSPELKVVEHNTDLEALGFEKQGGRDVRIEGRTYKGVMWSRQLS